VLLTEAKNEDAFMISWGTYETYQTKSIISTQWLQDHWIPLTYIKKNWLENEDPALPKEILTKKTPNTI
jgi:hypothetical protein